MSGKVYMFSVDDAYYLDIESNTCIVSIHFIQINDSHHISANRVVGSFVKLIK